MTSQTPYKHDAQRLNEALGLTDEEYQAVKEMRENIGKQELGLAFQVKSEFFEYLETQYRSDRMTLRAMMLALATIYHKVECWHCSGSHSLRGLMEAIGGAPAPQEPEPDE